MAALRVVDAAVLAIVGLDINDAPLGGVPILGSDTLLTQAIDLALAGLTVVGVVGLLLFRRWGWVLTMVLVGLSLLGDLIRVAIGDPTYLSLLLHVVTAFYLNGRAVRALASAHPEDAHPATGRVHAP